MPGVLSHFPVPVADTSDLTKAQLLENDLAGFRAGIQAGASVVIVGYADMIALSDSKLPACMCPEVLALLRKDLGFNGIIMTSALDNGVVTSRFKPGEAALNAFTAGADMLYRPSDLDAAFTEELCRTLSVPLVTYRVDARGHAKEEKLSLEEARSEPYSEMYLPSLSWMPSETATMTFPFSA